MLAKLGDSAKNNAKTTHGSILRPVARSDAKQGHPTRKNRKDASNAVLCFLISFYGLLKGYLCELTLFDLFGCGS